MEGNAQTISVDIAIMRSLFLQSLQNLASLRTIVAGFFFLGSKGYNGRSAGNLRRAKRKRS